MMNLTIACLCFAVMAFATGGVNAAELYVSPGGNDASDGKSLKTAFRTPQHAADLAQPGDTVLFAGGEYITTQGQGVMVITRSGAPGKPILFAPIPGQKPAFRNRGAWNAIKVVGASHIEFRGLQLRGMSREITREEAEREKSNLLNPRTCGNGLLIDQDKATERIPAHITVRDCDIRDFPGGGLSASHADYITFQNNVVAGCGFWAPYACSGISVYQPVDSDSKSGYKIIIRGNISFENYNYIPFYYSNKENPDARKVTDGNGIILDDYYNSQSFGGGAGKAYVGKTLVANNIVFDNGGSGIHVFKSRGVDIVHNYAANNNRHPDIREGQIFSNSSKQVRVLNNVLVAPSGKPVNNDYRNEEVVYDFNIYAATDGSTPRFTRDKASNILATPGLTLAGWAEGKRALVATPNSPLRKAGTPISAAQTDFFGKPRSKGRPDIGPFLLK
ncbi:MAG: right-handed parallel beta-helix repeat-containing protein [Fibrella sp.]|nr:right-handed parallel beta-helix repeat-containing protein [Armatimonadota bacterium]